MINTIVDTFLTRFIKSRIHHYVLWHDKAGYNEYCAKLPWHDRTTRQAFNETVKDGVVVGSMDVLEAIRPMLPGLTLVAVCPESTKLPGYITRTSQVCRLYLEQPQFTGRQVFIVGGDDLFEQTLHLVRNVYWMRSPDPIYLGRPDPYPIGLMTALSTTYGIERRTTFYASSTYSYRLIVMRLSRIKQLSIKRISGKLHRKRRQRFICGIVDRA